MPSIQRIQSIIAEEGVVGFGKRTVRFLIRQSRLSLQRFSWWIGGQQTFSVAGHRLKFYTGEGTERGTLGYIFNHERPVLEDLASELNSSDSFYDVGANVGVYSVLAGLSGAKDIVAIEPHPTTYGRLVENIHLNSFSPGVTTVPLAVSDESQPISFDLVALNEPGAGRARIVDSDTRIKIPAINGQLLTTQLRVPNPTVMKIDIEGAEAAALRGFDKVLNNVRLIYCESHMSDYHGANDENIEQILNDFGYSVTEIHRNEPQRYIKAVRE